VSCVATMVSYAPTRRLIVKAALWTSHREAHRQCSAVQGRLEENPLHLGHGDLIVTPIVERGGTR
jgi:hypothetical protein